MRRSPGHAEATQLLRCATPIFETMASESNSTTHGTGTLAAVRRVLLVDETEALVAIDAEHRPQQRRTDVEKTIYQTNLEAADEIARQLRLRNIGGLIIGDFIDMKSRRDQQTESYQLMKDRLTRDKARTHGLPISPLGLMEMTRQRAHESISDTIYENCPYCAGRGVGTPR